MSKKEKGHNSLASLLRFWLLVKNLNYIDYIEIIYFFIWASGSHRGPYVFLSTCVTIVRPLYPWEDPALTPAVAELHCHVAFGSDGQSGSGPDGVQPFPGNPGGNVTSSIKTWACCLRFILNPSCTSQIASIWSWTLVRKESSLQLWEDVCLLRCISSSSPQL